MGHTHQWQWFTTTRICMNYGQNSLSRVYSCVSNINAKVLFSYICKWPGFIIVCTHHCCSVDSVFWFFGIRTDGVLLYPLGVQKKGIGIWFYISDNCDRELHSLACNHGNCDQTLSTNCYYRMRQKISADFMVLSVKILASKYFV